MALCVGLVPLGGWAQAAAAPEASSKEETPADAPSAPGGGPSEGIEEILVRGQSQEGFALESQTSSVTAFSGEDLAALGIEDVTDLADFTPNLEIVSPGSTTATFFIRGVGLSDFSANAAGAVAIYQDDVPMNSPPLQVSQIFDVMAVGVLKGPQGSGPGRNASAGAIKMVSNKPNLSDFSASLRVSQGQFVSDDAPSSLLQDYEGAVGFPLVPDLAGARLAFRLTDVEPFFTNGCGGALPFDERPIVDLQFDLPAPVCNEGQPRNVPGGLPDRLGNRYNWAARGQVLIVPDWPTDVEILLNGHGSRRDQDGVVGQAMGTGSGARGLGSYTDTGYQEQDQEQELLDLAAPLQPPLSLSEAVEVIRPIFSQNYAENRPLDIRPYRGDYNKTGRQKLDAWGGFATATVSMDTLEISATTAYDGYESLSDNDTDFTPDRSFEITSANKAWQFYQDLSFEGELEDHPLTWNAGAYYLMEEIENNSLIDIALGANPIIVRTWQQELWSYGVYAGIGWDFMDDFTLIAGGRYNFERKSFGVTNGVPVGCISPLVPSFLPTLAPVYPSHCVQQASEEKTWTAPTGTIELLYRFSDETSVYLKYNRGWKSGHFNNNGLNCESVVINIGFPIEFAGPCFPREPAEPEEIDAFELGFSITGWEGRAHMEGALFHYDYKNYQVFLFEDEPNRPPVLQIINAEDARVLGAEIEMFLEPLIDFVPPAYDGLRFNLRAGWLESEFLDFTNTVYAQIGTESSSVQLTTDYTGNQLPNAPNFQVSGGFEWPVEIGRYGTLIPRYDFSWTDDVYFDPTEGRGVQRFTRTEDGGSIELPENTLGQAAHVRHNVRLTYRAPSGKLEVTGWCRNVTDVRYKNYAFDVSTFRNNVISFVGDPRSCGGEVVFQW